MLGVQIQNRYRAFAASAHGPWRLYAARWKRAEICRDVWFFGGPKWVEKTPVEAVYRVDSFCCRFWVGRPRWVQSVGPERPSKLYTVYLADPLWEAKMGAIWGLWDVKWGVLGSKMGTGRWSRAIMEPVYGAVEEGLDYGMRLELVAKLYRGALR